MQRRTEVRAIKWKHAGLRQFDMKRFRFARIHHEINVVLDQPEAVNHVARLLDVRHVNSEIIAHLGVDPVRCEPASNRGKLCDDLRAVASDRGGVLVPDRIRVLVFVFRIDLVRLNFADLENLREMRLRFGVRFGHHFHFIPADVDQLTRFRL